MIAFLSDIHLGTKLKKSDYLKSLDFFINKIKEHKEPCHCIFVCGDLFDHRLSIEDSRFASIFLLKLVCNECGRDGRTHVPVHFIHGTYSHDNEQYDIFIPMLQKIDNTEVFYTKDTCSGTLHNGMSVLYLPQIYGDFDYVPYFKNKYDIIVGHGPMSSDVKEPCKSAQYEITQPADILGKISNVCVFGHYHGYTEFGNNVFYEGSMLRWMYGEDEEKCFLFCNDDFTVQRIPNPFALEFKTIEVNSPEDLRDIISTEITTPHRFIIHTDKDDLETYHSIMNVNKKNQNLKFQVISNEEEITEDEIVKDEEISETNNSSIEGPIQSLISYISEKYNVDTSQEIHEYDQKINKEE